jgi:anti-sigma regulatory factor (Ser/Thr protein kinase)
LWAVDWYAELSDPAAVTELRHEIGGFLRRHGLPSSDFDAADLVVSELLSNVVRHAPGPAWVSLGWAGAHPVLVVHDLGGGFELDALEAPAPDRMGGRGLLIVDRLVAHLAVAARRAGGASVTVDLPVERATTGQHDPPRHTRDALPALTEADPSGGFGKEAFLRALIVQLARATEAEVGPELVEQLVAQVGADIGGQMEAAYREATGIVDRLSHDQVADCLVRLKHAIDARNSDDGAAVVLEERIALGDPGCRVVVHLGPPPEEVAPFSNRYQRAD